MIDRKELELLVRAQIQGGKDLDGVAKSIAKIGDSINEQTKAAERGENRIDELKASLEGLNLIQKQLAGQNSAINYFNRLTKSVADTEARLAKQTQRYEEYQQALDKAGKRTDAQQEKLIKYALAVEKTEKALASQRDALNGIESEFRAAGVAVDNLGAVVNRNLQLQAELGLVYNRGTESIKNYSTAVRAARDEQTKLAQANAEAERSARQFAAAEERAAAAAAARQRAAEEVSNARTNRNAEIAAQRRLDAEQKQAADRARELAALQKDIVDRSATKAFVDQGNAARETARQYTTLARAATDLNPKVGSLRDTIRDILNPSEKARSTINGLEAEVNDLAGAVAKIKGPVADYREQVDRLTAAQKGLASQAGLIDNFNRQVVALRSARAAFVEARAEVNRYAAEVAKGGESGAQFAVKLAQAQATLRGSAQALAQQVVATRQSREALTSAGIASNNLAASQARLNNAARSTVGSFTALEAAVEKYGQSVGRASRANRGFGDEGRTTLSYVQRLRGEVLSLIAAYGGLFTVINTARGAVQASSDREGIRNQLAISVGNDRAIIDSEYEYVKGQADRIGVQFDRTARAYAKFSASATLAGRNREEIRSIFETFTEVGRVANLSADDLDGVFKALEQITSKGKIQAEELRGQLGDRLFGAFQIAAKALQDQFPDLDKALQNGLVTSDQLVAIANEYRKVVADQLPAATQSLAAQQARLNTELFDFKLAVADSGFIESYSQALRELTSFLRSDQGKQFANTIGLAFKALTDIFIFLLKNIDAVQIAVQVFLGLFVVGRFAAAINSVKTVSTGFLDIVDKIKIASTAVNGFLGRFGAFGTVIKGALGVASAAIIGWEIGSYLRDKFQLVRDAGIYIATALAKTIAVIKASYEAAFAVIPEFARRAFDKVVRTITEAARNLTRIFAKLAGAAGFDELANTLNRAADSMQVGARKQVDVLGDYRASLTKELAQINRIREEMLTDSGAMPAGGVAANGRPVALPTPTPAVRRTPGVNGPTEGELAKRATEIESITRALETLEAKIDRSENETLARQIEAIDTQYAALARRIEKLGGEAGKAFLARLTASTNDLRKQVTDKFNEDLLKQQQALLKKTEDAEEAAGKRERLNLNARLGAIVSDYEQAYRELAELRVLFSNNNRDTAELEALRVRLDAAKAQRLEQEKVKFSTEELQRRESQLNETISARDKLLAAVRAQQETGNIDDVQAAQQLNSIQDQYLPKIVAAGEATRQWAIANSAIFANPEQQAVFLATLDATIAKATTAKTEFSNIEKAIVQGGVSAVNNGLNLMVDGLQGLVDGTKSVGEGFRGLLVGFAQFAAQFLRDIALMIIKQQIFNALARSGNPIFSAVGLAGGGILHSGGVVGQTRNRTRNVSPGWFANAPRYHSGGIAGLAPDEYPSILQAGEEVLSKDSPRNIMNGGAGVGGGGGGGGAQGVRVVLVDDRAKVPEAMNSPDGEQVFMQFARRNVSTLKQILK